MIIARFDTPNRKPGTAIEFDILRCAKRQAADEKRPLSDLLKDALESCLMTATPTPDRRDAAYRLFCEQPIRITPEQFRDVLQADTWDTRGSTTFLAAACA